MILSAKLANDKHLLLKQETYSPHTHILGPKWEINANVTKHNLQRTDKKIFVI